MQVLVEILNNKVLVIPFLVLIITQVFKTIYFSIKNKKLDLFTLLTTGGLPSSHSSLVSSLATVVLKVNGAGSAEFAIAVILAIIVMYDASGIRKAAGEHAKILNEMMEEKEYYSSKEYKKLKELLGHTKLEVFIGLLTGIFLTIVLY
jgi:acid phosphatase/vanadium-dependent haloperoxidase related protein